MKAAALKDSAQIFQVLSFAPGKQNKNPPADDDDAVYRYGPADKGIMIKKKRKKKQVLSGRRRDHV